MAFLAKFRVTQRVLDVVLAATFVLSAVLGSYIIVTDSYLWLEAATHAYGLILFVAIDLIAVVGIYRLPNITRVVALLLPTVQLAAMTGDLYTGLGSPGSLVQQAFREYLLNDAAFVALLVLQAVLVGLAFGKLVQPMTDVRFESIATRDGAKTSHD
jgi:hypothetical protein